MALAACLASLFVVVPTWRLLFPGGLAIVLTAISVIDRDSPGTGFMKVVVTLIVLDVDCDGFVQGLQRLTGNGIGIAFAQLVVSYFFSAEAPTADESTTIIIFLSVMALFGRYFMARDRYAYVNL